VAFVAFEALELADRLFDAARALYRIFGKNAGLSMAI